MAASGSAAITELDLLGKLNDELVSLVEHFSALVKAARPPAEEEMGGVGHVPRDRRPPGEMLDVFVEKLMLSGLRGGRGLSSTGRLHRFAGSATMLACDGGHPVKTAPLGVTTQTSAFLALMLPCSPHLHPPGVVAQAGRHAQRLRRPGGRGEGDAQRAGPARPPGRPGAERDQGAAHAPGEEPPPPPYTKQRAPRATLVLCVSFCGRCMGQARRSRAPSPPLFRPLASSHPSQLPTLVALAPPLHLQNGVQALLNELEAHYYSSGHRGQLPPHEPSEAMRELSQLALQAAPSGGPDLSGGP